MTTETPYTLRDLASMVADQYPGLNWYHGKPEPGELTAAEWAASCAQPETRCDELSIVWSERDGEVLVQAIVGDTQNAAVRAAYFAQLAPADVLRLLDALDAANARLADLQRGVPSIGYTHGEWECHNPRCGVLTYAAEWCPGCGSSHVRSARELGGADS